MRLRLREPRPEPRLVAVDRRQVDVHVQDALQRALGGKDREQADVLGEVDEQVDVTARTILSAGDASEHPKVGSPRTMGRCKQGPVVLPQPSSKSSVG